MEEIINNESKNTDSENESIKCKKARWKIIIVTMARHELNSKAYQDRLDRVVQAMYEYSHQLRKIDNARALPIGPHLENGVEYEKAA